MILQEPLHLNELVIAESNNLINALRQITPSVMYIAVASDDGFEVASFNRLHIRDLGEDGRVSSMVSSLQGLNEAIVSSLALGEFNYSVLTTDNGHFIVRRVPGLKLILAGVFDPYESLGKVLSATKLVAEQIAAGLNPNNPW